MRGVAKFVVFACMVTLASTCDLVHRPDCAVLPPGSFHPHEASCSQFYRCDEFHHAKAYACPHGQRFLNKNGALCAPETRVTCDRCPQAASRCGECSCSPTTPPPCLTTTPRPCTVEPTTESPTSWLPSSPTTSTVVWSTTERITESTTEYFTPQDCPPIPSCVGSATGTLHPYPPDCSKYLYCDDYDVAKLVSCNISDHFSPTELRCMSINEANCPLCVPDYTIPDMTTVTYFPLPDCPPIPDCLNQPPGSVQPYPPDCSKYIYCLGDLLPDISSCPKGQHFSPEYLTCLLPEVAECPICVSTTTTTPAPTTALPDCAPIPSCEDTEPGFKLPFPQDCGMYIYCESQTDFTFVLCAAGEYFSPTLRQCTLPEIAGCPLCNPGVSPYPTPTPVCPPTPDCSNSKPGDLQPFPSNCSMFIECSSSSVHDLKSCSAGQHFSPYNLLCEPIEQADCPLCIPSETITTLTTTVATTTFSSTTVLPDCEPIPSCLTEEPGSKLPFPQDCGMYIYCESQTDSSLVLCAAGEHFSPTMHQCTLPENAGCPVCNPGITPVPTPTPLCPPTPDCSDSNPGDLQPFPSNCSMFIECISSSEHNLKSCSAGQHFSPYNLRCEPIEQADCPLCIPSETTTTLTTTVATTTISSTTVLPDCEPIPSCLNEEPGSKLPFPQDCEMYIYCESQMDFSLVLCTAGEHFSPTLRQCTLPEDANCPVCNPGVTQFPTPTPVCPPTPDCSDSNADDLKPFPSNCSMYIECISSNEHDLKSCSAGQHFSPYNLRCEPIEQADCPLCIPSETTTTLTTTVATTTISSTTVLPDCEPIPSCLTEEPGSKLPFPQDCEMHIYCESQTDFNLVLCSAGEHFSPAMRQCTLPEDANCPVCNPSVTQFPTPTPVCPPTPDCSDSNAGDLQPFPSNCSMFIECISSSEHDLKSCSAGQHFSPYNLRCEPIEQADCPLCIPSETTTTFTTTIATTTISSTTVLPDCEPIPSCLNEETGSKLPFPQDCEMYIYCESQTDFSLVLCAVGEHFSPTMRQCTLPEDANCPVCNPGVTQFPTPTPVCPPTPDCSDSNAGDLQPFPSNCSMFIECINSIELDLKSCSAGQHFSPYNLRCEPIEQADCPLCIPSETTTTLTTTVATTTISSTTVLPDCEPIPNCLNEEPGSKLPFPQDCEMYIYCESQTDFSLVLCAAGEHFSPTMRLCTLPEDADCPVCNPGVTPFPTPTPVCPPTPDCSDSNPGDLIPFPSNCSMFIECISSSEQEFKSCSTGQHFSPHHLQCESIEQADCPLCVAAITTTEAITSTETITTTTLDYSTTTESITTTEATTTDATTNSEASTTTESTIITDASTTTEAITTSEATTTDSTTSTEPSTTTESTTITDAFTTTEVSMTDPPTSTISPQICPPPRICNVQPILIQVPPKETYPPDCSKYQYCYDRKEPYISSCPAGQHFSPTLLDCMDPELAQCVNCVEPTQ